MQNIYVLSLHFKDLHISQTEISYIVICIRTSENMWVREYVPLVWTKFKILKINTSIITKYTIGVDFIFHKDCGALCT